MKTKNFSDWAVALIVVACSAVLFLALVFALTGTGFNMSGRTLAINFHDITGVGMNANVKYAGALAGTVSKIEMLDPQERIATGDPANAVRVTVSLAKNVPELPADIRVSVAADTLLSDKFILLDGGNPASPMLANGATLQGISPTSFDKLARDLDGVIDGLSGLLSGTPGDTKDIFDSLRSLLTETSGLVKDAQGVITDTKPVVADAKVLMSDARTLIAENRGPITRTVASLDKAATSLDKLGTKSTQLLATYEPKLTSTINDFKVTAENLKVTATYAKILTRNLALKPSSILWGAKQPPLPTEQEILRSKKPIE